MVFFLITGLYNVTLFINNILMNKLQLFSGFLSFSLFPFFFLPSYQFHFLSFLCLFFPFLPHFLSFIFRPSFIFLYFYYFPFFLSLFIFFPPFFFSSPFVLSLLPFFLLLSFSFFFPSFSLYFFIFSCFLLFSFLFFPPFLSLFFLLFLLCVCGKVWSQK